MMPNIPTDWVAEEQLATELNVPRELLRSLRPTLAEDDFALFGHFPAWKKNAATAVALTLGLVWPPALPEGATAQKTAPEPETLTVASEPRGDGYHSPNRRIIRARRDNGELVDVQVMDSSKYVTRGRDGQPMKLRAQPSTSGPHWLLVGREPRFKGAY